MEDFDNRAELWNSKACEGNCANFYKAKYKLCFVPSYCQVIALRPLNVAGHVAIIIADARPMKCNIILRSSCCVIRIS